MAETQQIYDFAQRYLRVFTEPDPPASILDTEFARDAYGLGFRMDLGEGFTSLYPEDAFSNVSAFLRVAPSIDDPYVLGTAIFSRWRLVTHWEEQSALSEGNREWFIAALGRLAEITAEDGESESAFKGHIAKVEIQSNNISSAKHPVLDEMEQTLTIMADGRVIYRLSRPNADKSGHTFIWTDPPFKMDPEAVSRIFGAIGIAFPYLYTGSGDVQALDAPPGSWKMVVTNQWGRPYRTMGQLGTDVMVDGENISDLIRELTGKSDLLLFDGNPDLLNRIELQYRRGIPLSDGQEDAAGDRAQNGEDGREDARQPAEDAASQRVLWQYREKVVFDRPTETVEHVLEAGPGYRARSSMYAHGAVSEFLDDMDPDTAFSAPAGNPDDAVARPGEVTEYRLSMFTKYGNIKVYSGTYDALSVPPEWGEFIERALTFMSFFGYGELFDEGRYGRSLRRESDYVYVLVAFDNSENGHWYLSDDPSLIDGDGVLAPVDGETKLGQVIQIVYGTKQDAPIVFGSLKKIERKSTPEDLGRLRKQNRKPSAASQS